MNEMSEALKAAVEEVVATAPPLSDAQIKLIARLLGYKSAPRRGASSTISGVGDNVDPESFGSESRHGDDESQ